MENGSAMVPEDRRMEQDSTDLEETTTPDVQLLEDEYLMLGLQDAYREATMLPRPQARGAASKVNGPQARGAASKVQRAPRVKKEPQKKPPRKKATTPKGKAAEKAAAPPARPRARKGTQKVGKADNPPVAVKLEFGTKQEPESDEQPDQQIIVRFEISDDEQEKNLEAGQPAPRTERMELIKQEAAPADEKADKAVKSSHIKAPTPTPSSSSRATQPTRADLESQALEMKEARDIPRSRSARRQGELSPRLVSSIVATVLAQMPPHRQDRSRSTPRACRRRRTAVDEESDDRPVRVHLQPRRSRSRQRSRSSPRPCRTSTARSPRTRSPRRDAHSSRPIRSGTPPSPRRRRPAPDASTQEDIAPPWRKGAEHASSFASPYSTCAAEDAASRAVVRFLRHTRPGPGGWTNWKEIASRVHGIEGLGGLEWLLEHSLSPSHGARLRGARPEGVLHLRAAFRPGDTKTPWQRGSRIGHLGTRARGPRSEEAQQRRLGQLEARKG